MTRFNKTILLATALLTLAAASAEAVSGRIEDKGLKLGLNSADMKGAQVEPGLTPQTGFAAGAFLTLRLTGILSVQPEIIYTQKGAELESGPNPYEYHYSYVEVPVLWKLTIAGQGASFRPNIYAGPFVGFKVSAKIDTYLDPRQEESVEENLPSARGIDAGYIVGVGADMIMGPGRVLLEIRYGRSLLSAVTTGAEVMHSVVSIFLGYSFD
jgi:hypothetical protein